MKVDIGGGTAPLAGFVNLDPVHGEGDWKRRIQDGIPMSDGTVDEAYASHVLEHVPAGQERIDVFNEVWRALRSGGRFTVKLPVVSNGDGRVNWQAIADPTHVSLWCRESFWYFTGAFGPQADYGIRLWREESYEVGDGWEATCILVKP